MFKSEFDKIQSWPLRLMIFWAKTFGRSVAAMAAILRTNMMERLNHLLVFRRAVTRRGVSFISYEITYLSTELALEMLAMMTSSCMGTDRHPARLRTQS